MVDLMRFTLGGVDSSICGSSIVAARKTNASRAERAVISSCGGIVAVGGFCSSLGCKARHLFDCFLPARRGGFPTGSDKPTVQAMIGHTTPGSEPNPTAAAKQTEHSISR